LVIPVEGTSSIFERSSNGGELSHSFEEEDVGEDEVGILGIEFKGSFGVSFSSLSGLSSSTSAHLDSSVS
jgi:hypothetical protein